MSFLRCPPLHHKRIRTTNLIERAFAEQRRRTKTIPRFWDEKSCLKLSFAALLQASERWQNVRMGDVEIAIFGMGRVGTGAYDDMRRRHGEVVIGFDFDEETVKKHFEAGRKVILGDPTDHDFWAKIHRGREKIQMVMLTLPATARGHWFRSLLLLPPVV